MRSFAKKVPGLLLTMTFILFLARQSEAQVDSTATKKDTIPVKTDTIPVTTQPATTTTTTTEQKKSKRFIIYAGPNVSSLRKESDDIKDDAEAGWHIGLSWRSKGFFFSQFGLRYNNAVYSLRPASARDSGDYKFSVNSLDLPLTVGINLLPGLDRVLNIRGFISAVPSFNLGVGNNDYGYEKEKLETFNFAGSVGIGFDVLFMVIEVGYNHGFIDLLEDKESKPAQGFVNIGFRF
jgi:hypothetical protein